MARCPGAEREQRIDAGTLLRQVTAIFAAGALRYEELRDNEGAAAGWAARHDWVTTGMERT